MRFSADSEREQTKKIVMRLPLPACPVAPCGVQGLGPPGQRAPREAPSCRKPALRRWLRAKSLIKEDLTQQMSGMDLFNICQERQDNDAHRNSRPSVKSLNGVQLTLPRPGDGDLTVRPSVPEETGDPRCRHAGFALRRGADGSSPRLDPSRTSCQVDGTRHSRHAQQLPARVRAAADA